MEVNNIDSKPFFSVLVPVYNQEKYLPECIESVLNQTFKDFELILVDDGSTDSSGMLCDQYAQEHPRIITAIHQKNQGLLFARRTGIENANGEFYLFLDADDYFCGNALKTIYSQIEKKSVQMVFFNASLQADFKSKLNNYPYEDGTVLEGKQKNVFLMAFCGTHMFNNMCFKCIHSSLIDLHDYIDGVGVGYGEDLFQSIPLVDRAESFCILQAPLYFYRQHAESMTHYYNPAQFESLKNVCGRLMAYSQKWQGEYKIPLIDKAYEYAGNECYRTAKNVLKSNDEFGVKRNYLAELKKDVFYKKYVENKRMCSHLRMYEKFILFAVKSNSYMMQRIVSEIFSCASRLKRN